MRISRDPLSRAFLQLAEEYRKLGRYQDAVQVCLEGLARHPTYHTARISLGRTYMEAGNLEAARRALSEVLDLAPENHLAGKLLAEVQRKMGDLAGAVETYRGILRYYPTDREVGALLQDLQRNRPQAGRASEPALEYRSEDLPGATPRLDRRAALPAPAKAAETAPRAAPAGPGPMDDDALQTNTLAELYLRQGLVDRAVEVYSAMLRVDPGNAKARRRLRELAPGTAAAPPPPQAAAPSGPSGIDRLERWLRSIKAGRGPEASSR